MLGPIVSKEFLISAKIDRKPLKNAENGTENGKCFLDFRGYPKSFFGFLKK